MELQDFGHEDKEKLKQFKNLDDRQTQEFQNNLRRERRVSNWYYRTIENNEPLEIKKEIQVKGSRWSFLSKWWFSENDTDLLRSEQLDRNGALNPIDRDQIRADYRAGRLVPDKTSPTHSDPNVAQEYNRLFPKPDNSDSEIIKIRDNTTASGSGNSGSSAVEQPSQSSSPLSRRKPVSYHPLDIPSTQTEGLTPLNTTPLYSAGNANDSTETITPTNYNNNNVIVSDDRDSDWEDSNSPTDITASELRPLSRPESSLTEGLTETHTYPPQPLGKQTIVNYYPERGQPIVRGFQENIDHQFNPSIRRDPNVGILGLSARFLDQWKK